MDKNNISRLIKLNNKKANALLANFANEIKSKILQSKDNDEIFKALELLGEFVYKAPDQAIVIVKTVIKDKRLNEVKIYKGGFPGRDYKDLILECINLLEKVRYIRLPEVFNLLVDLYNNKNEQIKNGATKTLESLAGYDLYVLKHIGYSTQRKILDIVSVWNPQKKIKNIEIIKTIAKEFLEPSFEGVSMKDYQTMVFKSGALQPTEFLKKIRRETIDLLFSLYKQNKDIKTKINLLEILYDASSFPHQSSYGEEVIKMITDDGSYSVNAYEKIVFGKGNKIIADAPITQEIERQLVWFNKNHRDEIPKITRLLNKIRKDEPYDLYRTLIGSILDYSRKEGEGWREAEEKRNKKIDVEFKKINKNTIKAWGDKLNSIASYRDIVDMGKFEAFSGFLFRIAKEKPDLAEIILEDALVNEKPLKNFIGQFLFGFRQGNNLEIWDNYTEKIIEEKNINLIIGVVNSFFYYNAELKNIRKEDIKLLSQIIKKEKPFDFLKKVRENKLLNLNFSLIRVLLHIYRKNKKQIEGLIKVLIENDRDKQYLHMYLEQLGFPAYKNEIDLSEWSKESIKFILDKLVELKNLSYETQLLLLAIARFNFKSAMDVFVRRIKKREENEKREKRWISSTEYDAVPYHFNNELSEYINQKEESIIIIEGWVEKMLPKSSIYNIELAQFLQRIGGSIFKKILLKTIKKGNEDNLNRGINLMWDISSPDFDICFEIIKKTDDEEKIWKRLGGIMFNTGVVHGEYGISEAHERKIEEIKKYEVKGTKKEIERVKKFKEKIIKDLQEVAKQERQRAKEELKLRKLEFGE